MGGDHSQWWRGRGCNGGMERMAKDRKGSSGALWGWGECRGGMGREGHETRGCGEEWVEGWVGDRGLSVVVAENRDKITVAWTGDCGHPLPCIYP
jgi:hypothetical protein